MNNDYAHWTRVHDSSSSASSTLIADAAFYELVRIGVAADADSAPERPRFADVAVTEGHGERRFVAGYSTLSGSPDGEGPVRLWAHDAPAASVEAIPGKPGSWAVAFPGASVIERDGELRVLDNGFGVAAPDSAVTESADGLTVELSGGVEALLVSGPSADRILNRYALALTGIEQLPNY